MKVKEFSSERILFCFPKPEDANAFYENIDWSVIKNISGAPWPFMLDHAKSFIADAEKDRNNNICYEFLLKDKTTNQFIGIASLNVNVSGEPSGQIGYWITKACRGKGYAFEAVSGIIKLAKSLKLPKVWASARSDNSPSVNLLKKMGMVFSEERIGIYESKEMSEVIYELNLSE
ncbi:MAG: hypothetical protein BGO43_13025 [Gammaproteobacteria bacterium 39-13]|nr:GNAT family N-acetyltransferase [Gammaproteobacteria bacterium]OJV93723.1 MAG: hypothetical protein BGO43_13025 [Gammaproteobacteria bacterium 39-13]